jgi:hypothetical protein
MFPRRLKIRGFLATGVPSEDMEHICTVNHIRTTWPAALFTISPSGMKLPKSVAMKFSAMGYRAGTPDILILEPKGKYHGLLVEMKIQKGGKVSPEQTRFIEEAQARGYYAVVCCGAQIAIHVIDAYMEGKTV